MLAVAMEVAETQKEALTFVAPQALDLMMTHNSMTDEEFRDALFNFACDITAIQASLVVEKVMSKDDFNAMIDEIQELQAMGRKVENE